MSKTKSALVRVFLVAGLVGASILTSGCLGTGFVTTTYSGGKVTQSYGISEVTLCGVLYRDGQIDDGEGPLTISATEEDDGDYIKTTKQIKFDREDIMVFGRDEAGNEIFMPNPESKGCLRLKVQKGPDGNGKFTIKKTNIGKDTGIEIEELNVKIDGKRVDGLIVATQAPGLAIAYFNVNKPRQKPGVISASLHRQLRRLLPMREFGVPDAVDEQSRDAKGGAIATGESSKGSRSQQGQRTL